MFIQDRNIGHGHDIATFCLTNTLHGVHYIILSKNHVHNYKNVKHNYYYYLKVNSQSGVTNFFSTSIAMLSIYKKTPQHTGISNELLHSNAHVAPNSFVLPSFLPSFANCFIDKIISFCVDTLTHYKTVKDGIGITLGLDSVER